MYANNAVSSREKATISSVFRPHYTNICLTNFINLISNQNKKMTDSQGIRHRIVLLWNYQLFRVAGCTLEICFRNAEVTCNGRELVSQLKHTGWAVVRV
jgi:hypothetical protein